MKKEIIRKATKEDLEKIAKIYENIHTAEEKGEAVIGWNRNIYPTRNTAEQAFHRDDLFVMTDEKEEQIIGTAILNQIQVPEYYGASWEFEAPEEQIMVMHTLVIDPNEKSKGYGRAFASYYEEYARSKGCRYLRIDTNEKNIRARKFYKELGYKEIAIVPCVFNGIPDVKLVLLEKCLKQEDSENLCRRVRISGM